MKRAKRSKPKRPRSRDTVWLVDDDADLCRALSMLLSQEGFEVRAYTDPLVFLEAFEQVKPACVLLDVRMPKLDGFGVHDALKAKGVTTPVLFLSGHGDIPIAVRAVRGGALDFLEKPTRTAKLVEELRIALRYDAARKPARQSETRSSSHLGPHAPASLSARELEVARLLCQGLRNREVAEQLKLSVRTVEMHRTRMLRRLGAKTVVEATRILAAAGVIVEP